MDEDVAFCVTGHEGVITDEQRNVCVEDPNFYKSFYKFDKLL